MEESGPEGEDKARAKWGENRGIQAEIYALSKSGNKGSFFMGWGNFEAFPLIMQSLLKKCTGDHHVKGNLECW